MNCPFYLVDAFADKPLTGNPAGVCLLELPITEPWMQRIASEVNQAETAFIWPVENGWSLRWFTPTVEVDLCGHATLAAATVLDLDAARFSTKSGWLQTRRLGDEIAMDFPAEPVVESPTPFDIGGTIWQGQNRMDWFVVMDSEEKVRSFVPDPVAIGNAGLRGLCITAKSDTPAFDFVSRFFAPQSGVPEDSVTGSTHCGLACLWADRLGYADLTGYQASARGGSVKVHRRGDRVELRGRAHIVVRGELCA